MIPISSLLGQTQDKIGGFYILKEKNKSKNASYPSRLYKGNVNCEA